MRAGSGDRIQEYGRCRGGNVQIDVVEGRIIQETVTATNSRLAMAGHEAAPLRRISKAEARAETVVNRGNLGIGAYGKRQRRFPEGRRRVALTLRGDVVEQVFRLAVIRPGQTQVQGQVLP